jgi:pyruvate dehydrogenase phosphatase
MDMYTIKQRLLHHESIQRSANQLNDDVDTSTETSTNRAGNNKNNKTAKKQSTSSYLFNNNNRFLSRRSVKVATATTAVLASAAAIYTSTTSSSISISPSISLNSDNQNHIHIVSSLQPVSGPSDHELELQTARVKAPSSSPTSSEGIKLLSHEQINNTLLQHTQRIHVNQDHISTVEVSWLQANSPKIEDTFSIIPDIKCVTESIRINTSQYDDNDMNTSNKNVGGMLIGVFDGHSGNAASAFCRDELLQYILTYHRSLPAPYQTPTLLHPLPFIHADNDFLDYNFIDKKYDAGLSGACAVVVHVDEKQIQAANIGDCRAVVARKTGAASSRDKIAYEAVELTTDHQIENEAERERLILNHPNEPDIVYRNRVKGRLQPTRGMGDGLYKRNDYYEIKRQQYNRFISRYGWTAPYITAEPEIRSHEIQDNDDYLIVSTDGLFQDMTNQQVVDYVAEYVNHKKYGTPFVNENHIDIDAGLSAYLIRKALLHASLRLPRPYREDEQTALSSLLQLPEGMRRNIHDDLTVVVVKLDHEVQKQHAHSQHHLNDKLRLPVASTLQRALSDPERKTRQELAQEAYNKQHQHTNQQPQQVHLKSAL